MISVRATAPAPAHESFTKRIIRQVYVYVDKETIYKITAENILIQCVGANDGQHRIAMISLDAALTSKC